MRLRVKSKKVFIKENKQKIACGCELVSAKRKKGLGLLGIVVLDALGKGKSVYALCNALAVSTCSNKFP